jgi:hypothetical protein
MPGLIWFLLGWPFGFSASFWVEGRDKQLYRKLWNLVVKRAAEHDRWWLIAKPYLLIS